MTILLTILKVILWIILIILLILLGILLLVLLCPFHYKLTGHIKEEILTSGGGGEVSWLWGLVGGGGVYEDKKFRIFIRIAFWKKFLGGDDKDEIEEENLDFSLLEDSDESEENPAKAKPAAENQAEGKETEKAVSDTAKNDPAVPVKMKTPETNAGDAAETGRSVSDAVMGDGWEPIKPKSPEELTKEAKIAEEAAKKAEKEEKEKADPVVKISESIRGILEKLEGLPPKAEAAVEKAESLLDTAEEKYDMITGYLGDEGYRKAVLHIIKEILSLIVSILPHRFDLDLDYSAGSPDLTGQILALVSALPIRYRFKWGVRADFESDHFYAKGDVALSGAVRLYKVITMLVRLLFDRQVLRLVWTLIRLVKEKKKKK